MYSSKFGFFVAGILFFASIGIGFPNQTAAMGSKPDKNQVSIPSYSMAAPESNITLKELANIYWPDSNATQVQQEETLKNLLGKKVNWDVTVAQIQREGPTYIIQGQSDKNMLGTFSYVVPKTDSEREQILKASRDSVIHITGIVKDMRMRHIVLDPVQIIGKAE